MKRPVFHGSWESPKEKTRWMSRNNKLPFGDWRRPVREYNKHINNLLPRPQEGSGRAKVGLPLILPTRR